MSSMLYKNKSPTSDSLSEVGQSYHRGASPVGKLSSYCYNRNIGDYSVIHRGNTIRWRKFGIISSLTFLVILLIHSFTIYIISDERQARSDIITFSSVLEKSVMREENKRSKGEFSSSALEETASGTHTKKTDHSNNNRNTHNYTVEKRQPITRIALLGERNSGTSWVFGELERCFQQTSLSVTIKFTRFKHWFQKEDIARNRDSTLVIAQFRDPYNWVDAMRRKPHHAAKHLFLDWKTFVTRPWTMERVGYDLDIISNTTSSTINTNVTCQEYFKFHEVVSCVRRPYQPDVTKKWKTHWSERQPLYEMRNDGSGEPYDSILQLRRDKIYNFLETKTFSFVQDHVVVRYEDLVMNGTGALIRHIEEATGVQAQCRPTPGQTDRKVRKLDAEYIQWMSDHVDWEAESLIGYTK